MSATPRFPLRMLALSAVLGVGLASAPAHGNDSSAELAAGGLVLTRNDDIVMRAEDLFISTQEVRVDYRFFNKAARDVTIQVAFPMPDIAITGPDENISVPTENPVNFLDFATTVNGAPVETKVEQRAISTKGIDETRFLAGLGIPLGPHLAATGQALDALSAKDRDEVVRRSLAEIEEFDVGKGMQKHLAPRWTLKTTYYWQQTFAREAETRIAHRYKPSVGGTVQTVLGAMYLDDTHTARMMKKYCIDNGFMKAVRAARGKLARDAGTPLAEERVDYILSTGANWSGPIGDFRLVVDKGSPANLVSFCGDGVRKIGPTQFEMRKTNFTPQGNLAVLILKPIPR